MKSPAFQFYPTDYLGSMRVQMMSCEEEGIYIRLLAYCWQNKSLPADRERLSRLIAKPCSDSALDAVVSMFRKRGTKLVHDRLEVERKKQKSRRTERSTSGKKGSKVRWKNDPQTLDGLGKSIAEPSPKNSFPSPIPIPIPIPVPEIQYNREVAALPFSSPEFSQAWANWKTHLREKKKPLKPGSQAEKQQLIKLAELGHEKAIAALAHSSAGNYQGIYEPKANGAPWKRPDEPARVHIAP